MSFINENFYTYDLTDSHISEHVFKEGDTHNGKGGGGTKRGEWATKRRGAQKQISE